MTTHLKKVKHAVHSFEQLQKKLSHYGAEDTEPDGVFQSHIAGALKGFVPKETLTGSDWDLFTSSMDTRSAAKRLTAASRKACQTIKDAIDKSDDPADIHEYIKGYCWRVSFD